MSDFLGILKPSGGPVTRAQKRREISFFLFFDIYSKRVYEKRYYIRETTFRFNWSG
jgi:hypothetical protein